jgi:hypothetical protein
MGWRIASAARRARDCTLGERPAGGGRRPLPGFVAPSTQEIRVTDNSLYDGYFEARDWSRDVSAENYWYYDELRARCPIAAGSHVLEIGFGDGRFLDWCKARSITPVGVEILDQALNKACALGHEVHAGPFTPDTLQPERSLDLIAMFDVAEHLTTAQLTTLLGDTLPHLATGGKYLLRFPNGNSPFVGPIYRSDITHVNLLNAEAIGQIARPLGLRVSDEFNDRLLPPGFVPRLKRRMTYGLRAVLQAVIGFAYFGRNLPLDPNVYVVLERRPT